MLSQQLVNGLVLGSTYALFALGFTLIFGVLRVINLTYGFYFSIGAFVALTVARQFGANIWVALPLGALSAGLVAVVSDWILLTRLRRAKAGELASLMVTLGAVLALYSLMAVFIGTDIQRFPFGFVDNTAIEFGGIRISLVQMLIVSTTFPVASRSRSIAIACRVSFQSRRGPGTFIRPSPMSRAMKPRSSPNVLTSVM